MKKRWLSILIIAIMSLLLSIPAYADVIYEPDIVYELRSILPDLLVIAIIAIVFVLLFAAGAVVLILVLLRNKNKTK